MKYKTKDVTNYRSKPSAYANVIGKFPTGKEINVLKISGAVVEKDKKTGKNVSRKWGSVKVGDKTYYVNMNMLKKIDTTKAPAKKAKPKVDYGKKVADCIGPATEKVLKNKSKHVSGIYNFSGSKINCGMFVSYIFHKAGVLGSGKYIYHTDRDHSKATISDCARGTSNVKHYKWVKTNAVYSKLSADKKVKGCVYFYKSSVAIQGADGVYGCHSSGETYDSLSMIRHRKGSYEMTEKILVVGIPQVE